LVQKPKILCVRNGQNTADSLPPELQAAFDVVEVSNPIRALAQLSREKFAGVYVTSEHFGEAVQLERLMQNERILEGMPDGVVLLDGDNTVLWANETLREWTVHCAQMTEQAALQADLAHGTSAAAAEAAEGTTEAPCEAVVATVEPPAETTLVGQNFYLALNSPEILGPDFCPFHTALATGQASTSTLRCGENRYFQVHAAPLSAPEEAAEHLIVTVRDVTVEMLQQQKLAAIHKAGIDLADLTPDEVFNMQVEDRIELLKSNILHYTKDLLNFDVVEIRLLEQQTGQLEPLLSVGLDKEATSRALFARPQHNGVTGFVAATGKSYLCEDTAGDPLYIEGFKGAKSSLTVPLILHEEVIGTFNVESPLARAFSESDLQFLEIFSRDVALALNTLELLVAQKANTAQESVEAIHSAVALPIDEILNEAVNVMETYIGHEPQVVERLQHILRNARDIKQVIQKVGQKMTPVEALPASAQIEERPKLHGRRVLVVDADEGVRSHAHALLERYRCTVETAHGGYDAVCMVRRSERDAQYDVVIADIRLPDMNGYELLLKLQQSPDPPPLVLMTGFGYDPGHSIVKARQAGLHPKAVLYKPFRLDQLLETVEAMLDVKNQSPAPPPAPPAADPSIGLGL
jgi:CheY-like chemotaxis protein